MNTHPPEKDRITQFKNCHILRDHNIIKEDLWVRNGKVINPEPLFFEEQVYADITVDCGGLLIAPGFIDVQINGGFGVDFSCNTDDVRGGIRKVAKGILPHGVTSFCPTIVTSPLHIYEEILPKIDCHDGNADGAGVLGLHIEGPYISKVKHGAHPVEHIREFDIGFTDVLQTLRSLHNIKIITLAPELKGSAVVIKELVSRDVVVSLGHSMGNLVQGEEAVNSGANFITHLFNAMLPFHHRDPGLVGLLTSTHIPDDRTVFFGIIADGIHTHPAALRIAHRTHPKGLVLVTDAVSPLGLEDGRHFLGQEIVDVVGPRAFIANTDTLCGCIISMNECVKTFMKSTGCSKVEALECASLHPAQALNITSKKGTLDFGTDADFIFLDDKLNVLSTYIAGECVFESSAAAEQCRITNIEK